MHSRLIAGLLLSCIGLVISFSTLQAASSRLSIEYGEDDQGGSSKLLDIDQGLDSGMRLIAGYGRSNQQSISGGYTTSLYYLGLGSDPHKDFSIKGLYEESGKSQDLIIQSFSTPLTFKNPDLTFTLTPVFRTIDIYTITNKVVSVDSNALGLQLTGYPGQHGRVMASYFTYDYSRRVNLLTALKIIPFFSNSTLQLASGFLDESLITEIGMDYDAFSWTLGWNRSVSALDASVSEYGYLSLDVVFSDSWSMYATYGKYLHSINNNDNFITVGINYAY